jgi:hypothetical protein
VVWAASEPSLVLLRWRSLEVDSVLAPVYLGAALEAPGGWAGAARLRRCLLGPGGCEPRSCTRPGAYPRPTRRRRRPALPPAGGSPAAPPRLLDLLVLPAPPGAGPAAAQWHQPQQAASGDGSSTPDGGAPPEEPPSPSSALQSIVLLVTSRGELYAGGKAGCIYGQVPAPPPSLAAAKCTAGACCAMRGPAGPA